MKIELIETKQIKLIPETIQDKVWLTLFMRDATEQIFKCTEFEFKKQPEADWCGSGFADAKKVGVFDELNGIDVDYSDITELSIYNHPI